MKSFIDKENLICELQNIKIDADCFSKVMGIVQKIPTIYGQCGICKKFERYNSTRGLCNKHNQYMNYNEFCSDWESGVE